MDCLTNAIKGIATGLDGLAAQTRLGTVQSYDPVNYAVKVLIQPENVLSGWLPLGTVGAGASSFMAGPNVGDHVVLTSQEGDGENLIVSHRLFSTENMPQQSPASPNGTGKAIQSGEFAFFHQSGAFLHFAANGTVYGAGTLHWNGQIQATGEITAGYGGSDSVTLQKHTHNQPNDSHGDSEPTTDPPNAGT